MGKFDEDGLEEIPVEDDPFWELFADCETSEDVMILQKEIEDAGLA